jgi:Protein of unknown function DUF262/Protein of unknown function (DUF1524)
MNRVNILNTRTINYQELIGNGKVFRVPIYQRDYSWSEEQWEDLWNDIFDLRASPEDRHYMGALVVEGKNDRDFLIIDGQQRMATLSILGLAVIAKLGEIAARGIDSENNRQRAEELRNRFIGEKDPASLVENSRMTLNETDNAFYQDYIVQLRPPLNPRGLPKSNRLLWQCFQYFLKRLDDVSSLENDGPALARILSETAARQLLFIFITVDDDLNAYTVFETLNARGLELTTTDLLKNYLFSRVKVQTDLEALQRRWRGLIATIGQERFPEFLRYHLLCEQPKIRTQRLFKLVRDRARTPEDVFALLTALEGRAELFSALSDSNHGYWAERPDARPYIRDLNLFRVRQMTPLLFAAWEKFSLDQFVSVLRLVSVISFRYTVVSGLNTNTLEPVYHEAAKAVLNNQAPTASGVFDRLKPIYVDDIKFMQDFALLALDTGGQRNKLAKYILARLEADASGRAVDPDTDPGTIEHILPENPQDEWGQTFSRDLWEAAVYRLGNLTLLESSLNRRIANGPYSEKIAAYAQSNYVLTRRIPEIAPQDWTFEFLSERQRSLAQRAVHLWRSDFS